MEGALLVIMNTNRTYKLSKLQSEILTAVVMGVYSGKAKHSTSLKILEDLNLVVYAPLRSDGKGEWVYRPTK